VVDKLLSVAQLHRVEQVEQVLPGGAIRTVLQGLMLPAVPLQPALKLFLAILFGLLPRRHVGAAHYALLTTREFAAGWRCELAVTLVEERVRFIGHAFL
jgi:hypothetical protein